MRISCFDKVKNKKVIALRDAFYQQVPEDADMSESEQKEIGKKLLMDYYAGINQELNDLKEKINPDLEKNELPDNTDKVAQIEKVYSEKINQIEKNETRNAKRKQKANEVPSVKAVEDEAEVAGQSDNIEIVEDAIDSIDAVVNSTPEQQARNAGEKDVSGTIVKRQDPIQAVTGNEVNVLFQKKFLYWQSMQSLM